MQNCGGLAISKCDIWIFSSGIRSHESVLIQERCMLKFIAFGNIDYFIFYSHTNIEQRCKNYVFLFATCIVLKC